jgi:light-harvesting complex 1 alpha chain
MAEESARANIYKIWLLFDPRRVLTALFIFLTVLALLIHFLSLSSARFNWLEGAPALRPATAAISAPAAVQALPAPVK